MIMGLTVGAFLLAVVWPAVDVLFSIVVGLTDSYEGMHVEEECGEGFEMWYNTFG